MAKLSSQKAFCKQEVTDLTDLLELVQGEVKELSQDHDDLLGGSTVAQDQLDKLSRDLEAARKQYADNKISHSAKVQAAQDQLDKPTRDLEAARKQSADVKGSQLAKDQRVALTRNLETVRKQCPELRTDQLEEYKVVQEYLDIPRGNSDPTRKQFSELQRKNAILRSPHQAKERVLGAEHSEVTQDLEIASQHYQELKGAQSRLASELGKTVTGLEQDFGAAKRRTATLTGEIKAVEEHVHDVDTRAADIQSSQDKVAELEQDLGAANRRVATLIAELMVEKDHSHDVDTRIAEIQSSQDKVTALEGDLGGANERIATLTTELTAAKKHSHNVDTLGSTQVRELEGDVAALDQHVGRLLDDNAELIGGIHKIKGEDGIAKRDVARLKARVAELEKELIDNRVAYKKETKENITRVDRILQLAVPQASAPTLLRNSNSVGTKRSSPTSNSVSVTSSQKRTKIRDSQTNDAIDLTSSDTEHSKAKVQGLVPDTADQTKFTLITQSDLPQAIQDKVNGWIQKLDAHPVKNGMSPWLIAGNKVKTTCAVRRFHKPSCTWRDDNLDRACMDCSKKGYPCIVIRTTGPVLLPLYRPQGLSSSNPEYWIKPTK